MIPLVLSGLGCIAWFLWGGAPLIVAIIGTLLIGAGVALRRE